MTIRWCPGCGETLDGNEMHWARKSNGKEEEVSMWCPGQGTWLYVTSGPELGRQLRVSYTNGLRAAGRLADPESSIQDAKESP